MSSSGRRIVAFRVDASIAIGSGHFMRCMALANVLKVRGAEIHLLHSTLPGEYQRLAKERGFITHNLSRIDRGSTANDHEGWSFGPWSEASQKEDARASIDILASAPEVDLLVVDHYGIDARWETAVRGKVKKILVLDDLADRSHDCDFLLDQNFYIDQNTRYKPRLATRTQLLLGPRYALLRPEFVHARLAFPRTERPLTAVERINVCFGGVDVPGETMKALEALEPWLRQGRVRVDVILPSSSPHRETMQVWANRYATIDLHVSPNNLAELLAKADIGLGASGGMTWERACVGLPSIAVAIAPNQQGSGENAGRAGIQIFAGKSGEVSMERLRLAIDFLMNNPPQRQSLAETGQRFIDGQGTQRVAGRVLTSEITLRQASMEDCKNIFVWRNAPVNRFYAHGAHEITYEEHQRWFEGILQASDRFLLIGSDAKGAVGVLRYDREDGTWLTSMYLVPERHGEGLATALLVEGLEWLKLRSKGSITVWAEIRPENIASQIVFERAGYEKRFSTFVIEVVA